MDGVSAWLNDKILLTGLGSNHFLYMSLHLKFGWGQTKDRLEDIWPNRPQNDVNPKIWYSLLVSCKNLKPITILESFDLSELQGIQKEVHFQFSKKIYHGKSR